MASTILIVDDEIEVTRALSRVVASPDRRVITFQDPYEALDVVEKEVVDLVITDKDMPQMSGHMLLDALRASHPDIPCVILTGAPNLESAMIAINAQQVVRYLSKPYNPMEMRETVDAGLARRAANQALLAAERAAAERETLLKAVMEVDAGALEVTPGSFEAAGGGAGALGESVDDVVRRLAEEDPTAVRAVESVRGAIEAAKPSQIAEAVAGIPARRGTVGAVITPGADGDMSTIAVDIRGKLVELGTVSRREGDAVAARLAAMAGMSGAIGGASEQLGRLSVKSAGASGELIVGYRHTASGSAVEVRRVLVGSDEPGKEGVPTTVDKYAVLEKLGEGGCGVVYRGVHRGLEREVAIKILHGVFRGDPIAVGRFLREARTASRARHPRIVEVLDFGNLADGRPYLVMELVEAETLLVKMRGAVIEPFAAVRIARGIAEGLAAAHAVGVVHRDVKPSNVFVDDDVVDFGVKLADFGAAKMMEATDGLTRDGMILGTPSYMSPEHIMGLEVDGRTDVYALGCILFQMLMGQVPYRASNTRALLAMHLNADIPPLKSPRGAAFPQALVSLVRSMMAKDAGHRPQSADDVAEELASVLVTTRRAS